MQILFIMTPPMIFQITSNPSQLLSPVYYYGPETLGKESFDMIKHDDNFRLYELVPMEILILKA